MNNYYDFNMEIQHIQGALQTITTMAETVNQFLSKVPKEALQKIVSRLKEQYRDRFINEKKRQDEDEEEYEQKKKDIQCLLNFIAREKMTYADQKSVNLAETINKYYTKEYIKIKKQKAFKYPCCHCHKLVSNYLGGKKLHQTKCIQAPRTAQSRAKQSYQGELAIKESSEEEKKKNGKKKYSLASKKKSIKKEQESSEHDQEYSESSSHNNNFLKIAKKQNVSSNKKSTNKKKQQFSEYYYEENDEFMND